MKHALAAYGVVLVVLLMLVREYEAAGWTDVGALQLTAALVNSLLVLAVAAGVLLAGRLGLESWARSMARWRRRQARAAGAEWPDAEVVGVTSWRSEPPAVPAQITAVAEPVQTAPASPYTESFARATASRSLS